MRTARNARRQSMVLRGLLLGVALLCSAVVLWPSGSTRECKPPWRTVGHVPDPSKLALVTFQDSRRDVPTEEVMRIMGLPYSADPVDVLALTWPQKTDYTVRHGYSLIDSTASIATKWQQHDRKPSWNKLRAVNDTLVTHDWAFWLDADTVITNPAVRLEDLLPAAGGPDLILTIDPTGVNAGAWFLRDSPWAREFLNEWWDCSEFVLGTESTKSGDNDALKYLIRKMPADEHARHVGYAPQCAFNSYIWRRSLRQYVRMLYQWGTMRTGFWVPGDFIVHLAGYVDKFEAIMHLGRAQKAQMPAAPLYAKN